MDKKKGPEGYSSQRVDQLEIQKISNDSYFSDFCFIKGLFLETKKMEQNIESGIKEIIGGMKKAMRKFISRYLAGLGVIVFALLAFGL